MRKQLVSIFVLLLCATVSFAQIKDFVDATEKLWNQPKDAILANLHHLYEERDQIQGYMLLDVITYLSGPNASTELYFKNNLLVAVNHFYYGPNDTLDKYEQIALQELGPSVNDNPDAPQWITTKSYIALQEARGSFVLLKIKEKDIE
jgi:hypothetical protein